MPASLAACYQLSYRFLDSMIHGSLVRHSLCGVAWFMQLHTLVVSFQNSKFPDA